MVGLSVTAIVCDSSQPGISNYLADKSILWPFHRAVSVFRLRARPPSRASPRDRERERETRSLPALIKPCDIRYTIKTRPDLAANCCCVFEEAVRTESEAVNILKRKYFRKMET